MADSTERDTALEMLSQVRARLIDLEQIISTTENDLSGVATKLDRIDDKIYLLEVQLEKGEVQPEPSTATSSEKEPGEYLEGVNREQIADTASDLNDIYREGRETLTELNEAWSDIRKGFGVPNTKSPFSK